MELNNLRAIVTAGGGGIGRVVAETLVGHGARVHLCDVDAERLHSAAAIPGVTISQADVSDPAQVERLFADAQAALGGLDLLVNNAGIAGPAGPVEELDPAEWDRTMAVNINSHFYCARRAVPRLKAAGGGSIVNMSSAAGLFGYPLRGPYAASKWAVIGFTKTLAMELGEFGIRVNAICPGPVAGPRIDGVIADRARVQGRSFEQVREQYLRQNSLHTFIQAQDIADLILFLLSPAGRKFSGQALAPDGNTETLRI